MGIVLAVLFGGIALWFVIFVAVVAIVGRHAEPSALQIPPSRQRRRSDQKQPAFAASRGFQPAQQN